MKFWSSDMMYPGRVWITTWKWPTTLPSRRDWGADRKVELGFVTEPATRFEALNLTVKGRIGGRTSPGKGKLMMVETMLSLEGISPITALKCVSLLI